MYPDRLAVRQVRFGAGLDDRGRPLLHDSAERADLDGVASSSSSSSSSSSCSNDNNTNHANNNNNHDTRPSSTLRWCPRRGRSRRPSGRR